MLSFDEDCRSIYFFFFAPGLGVLCGFFFLVPPAVALAVLERAARFEGSASFDPLVSVMFFFLDGISTTVTGLLAGVRLRNWLFTATGVESSA